VNDDITTRSSAAAAVADLSVDAPDAAEAAVPDACPACGSGAYSAMLSPRCASGERVLVSCARCGFLRYLGEPQPDEQCGFSSFFLRRVAASTVAGQLLEGFRALAATGPVRFVLHGSRKKTRPERILVADTLDGTFSRSLQRGGVRCVALIRSLEGAAHATHRQGVDAVVAHGGTLPMLPGAVDAVVRMRGFVGESDPAGWLMQAGRQIAPGGRIVLQVFDCASWAFLLSGSQWVGLVANEGRFAYRAEDLEVLLDLCGLRIVRRSHFFPLLNSCAWVSSILPSLNVIGPNWSTQAPPHLGRVLGYLFCVAALLPLALAESLCHAGSVMLLEVEQKR
jgi:hypothetical protein